MSSLSKTLLSSHCFIEILYFLTQKEWIELQLLNKIFYEKTLPKHTSIWNAQIPSYKWLYYLKTNSNEDEAYMHGIKM